MKKQRRNFAACWKGKELSDTESTWRLQSHPASKHWTSTSHS